MSRSRRVRTGVGEEGLHFRGRRQDADGVEEGPAEELAVGAKVRWLDAQSGELGEDVLIDEVVLLRQPFRRDRPIVRCRNDDDGHLGLERDP